MIVVADSSPLVALVNIGHIDVLPGLFGQVFIPPQISAELIQSKRPQRVRDFIASGPNWLRELVPLAFQPIAFLHAGEVAAISLAEQLRADLLLIDEVRGRRIAAERRIPFAGTIGVLELAADQDLLDLRQAFESLKKTDFWVSRALLDERLKLYISRKGST